MKFLIIINTAIFVTGMASGAMLVNNTGTQEPPYHLSDTYAKERNAIQLAVTSTGCDHDPNPISKSASEMEILSVADPSSSDKPLKVGVSRDDSKADAGKIEHLSHLFKSSSVDNIRKAISLLADEKRAIVHPHLLNAVIQHSYGETDHKTISHIIRYVSDTINEGHEYVEESRDVLYHFLGNDNPEISSKALLALSLSQSVDKNTLVPYFRDAVISGTPKSRAKAIAAYDISEANDPLVTEFIKSIANDENESLEIRLSAIQSLH